MIFKTRLALLACVCCASPFAYADTELPVVQVTATRTPEPLADLPASVTVITGDELRARGANDLRSALALVAGVEGTPTGDGGPAGSVPALWGLREVDAFLLVIDGVPAGGAFNPTTVTADMTGIERIEVLRGAAPVMYGATSFNGVIHIIHYAPGHSAASVSANGGSNGSGGASFVGDLPAIGGFRQGMVANVEQRGFKTDREDYQRYHLLYRGGSDVGDARFNLDGDVSAVRQSPGNVIFRNGANLRTDLIPIDANHNPSDARSDQNRVQLNAGLTGEGWGTTLSVTRTTEKILRGFLRDTAPTPDADTFDADGYDQSRQFTDVYFDAHVISLLAPDAKVTLGFDYLHGKGRQNANNYGYFIDIDGSNAPEGAAAHHDEIVRSEDQRDFAGLYAQLDWKVGAVDVLAGARINHTREATLGEEILNDVDQMASQGIDTDSDTHTRPSGVLGLSWETFRSGNNYLTLYTDYRNTFKPLAVDFGPEAEVDILEPETSNSYEAGARGTLFDGRLSYDTSVFQLDFRALKTLDTAGNTVNAGQTRFRGGEIETRLALVSALQLMANYAYHDSRFIHFNRDGTPGGVVDGRRFEMAPHHLAGLGVIYAPALGFNASVVGNYTGQRVLNKSNSLSQGGFGTVDASVGYRFRSFALALNGYNLTDRREPIAESELAETVSGASSYYMLPATSVVLNVSMPL